MKKNLTILLASFVGASLLASCSPIIPTYTISWEVEDQIVKTTSVLGGETPVAGFTPTKAPDDDYSYTFDKWTPDLHPADKNETYSATFSRKTREYTITWNVDGATSTTQVAKGGMPSYSPDPTKGEDEKYTYTFSHWSPELAVVTADATYTAVFDKTAKSFAAEFENNGGTGGALSANSYTYSETDQTLDIVDPTKVGYALTYSVERTGTSYGGDAPTINGDTLTIPGESYGSFKVKANWTANTYSIAYDLNGGTISGTNNNPTSATFDTAFNVPDTPTKTGYTLDYWEITGCSNDCDHYKGTSSTSLESVGKVTEFNTSYRWFKNLRSTAGTVTFKAIWKANKYTVTFDPLNGSNPFTQDVNYGKKCVKPDTDPIKDFYEFDGWYFDKAGQNKVNFDTFVVTENTTVYAIYNAADVALENIAYSGDNFMFKKSKVTNARVVEMLADVTFEINKDNSVTFYGVDQYETEFGEDWSFVTSTLGSAKYEYKKETGEMGIVFKYNDLSLPLRIVKNEGYHAIFTLTNVNGVSGYFTFDLVY